MNRGVVEFHDLPYGNYVVFAYHDENNNDILDHNWLNMPREPLGYSNDWNVGLFSGMPIYEKTKFSFSADNTTVTIRVD